MDDALARGVLPTPWRPISWPGEDSDLSLWFQRQYALHLAELQPRRRDGGGHFHAIWRI